MSVFIRLHCACIVQARYTVSDMLGVFIAQVLVTHTLVMTMAVITASGDEDAFLQARRNVYTTDTYPVKVFELTLVAASLP